MDNFSGTTETGYAFSGGEAAAEEAGECARSSCAGASDFEDYDEDQEEGSEDYGRDETFSLVVPLETPKQKLPLLLAYSLLGAWIVFLVAVGWRALKGGGPKDLATMPLDSDSLLTYRDRFRESADKLEATWNRTSETVKNAFAKYHLPTIHDEEQLSSSEAWSLLQRQIDAMNQTPSPEALASTEEKWKYAAQLQLVTSLCNSASQRLSSMDKLGTKAEKTGFRVFSLGRGDAPMLQLPSDDTAAASEEMTSSEFLKRLFPRTHRQMQAAEVRGTAPRSLGLRLEKLVQALDMYTLEGLYVAMGFDGVLQAFGLALGTDNDNRFISAQPISSPADRVPADARVLLQFISEQFEQSTQTLWSLIVAETCTKQWGKATVEKLLQSVERGEEERARELLKRKRDLVQQAEIEKALPRGHILALSLFLL
ncbi:hypothetical protein, conserved [Eimeria maxima]|uniref:Transmembrane protein n=1 Tax=Eimeria maxima TaxID=5804 RepID=U6M898_EIMMA|nr:hypothetical protein, conserved [Eimeria maxima]CDJ59288.1 hypothetical protein, conserved [Eimeria maxima]